MRIEDTGTHAISVYPQFEVEQYQSAFSENLSISRGPPNKNLRDILKFLSKVWNIQHEQKLFLENCKRVSWLNDLKADKPKWQTPKIRISKRLFFHFWNVSLHNFTNFHVLTQWHFLVFPIRLFPLITFSCKFYRKFSVFPNLANIMIRQFVWSRKSFLRQSSSPALKNGPNTHCIGSPSWKNWCVWSRWKYSYSCIDEMGCNCWRTHQKLPISSFRFH